MTREAPERLNIADRFLDARVREGSGERTAVRTPDGSWTYAEVRRLAHGYGHVLRELGVRQEERVLLALPDGIDYVGALFGVLEIGAVVVMANPRLERDRMARLLDYVRPSVAVVAGADAVSAVTEVAVSSKWPREVLVTGRDPGAPSASFDPSRVHRHPALAAGAPEVIETADTHRDDPAIWLFSGGTTGRPKAVVQTHRSFANTTELYARRTLGWRETDVTLSIPKLFFGYATGSNLFFPFSVGASAVLFEEHPTPELVFDLVERFRPTILINVPTMVNRMVNHEGAEGRDLSSLRFATSAGEALPAALHERWTELFGVELLDGLGTAEMWHIFLTNRPGEVRPGTLGRPVEGFDVRVRDEEGRDLPDGEVGRLWVRGDSRAIAYWQNMDKTAEAFRGEWFVGGDLVSRDADGFVTYCGRDDDVMKVAGRWCAPGEVESCLLEHPAVKECAVVGVESEDGLTKPVAFAVLADGAIPDEDGLKTHCLEGLEAYKHPRRILFLSELPRTHLGKVDRGELKDRGSRGLAGSS